MLCNFYPNPFKRLKQVYCYSLYDLVSEYPHQDMPTLSQIFSRFSIPSTTNTLEEELFTHIYGRYWKEFCLFTEEEIGTSESEVVEAWYPLILKMYNIIQWTKQKYETLISYYTSNLTKLMDGVEASSRGTSRFNDTPQGSGDYSDDPHTSSINQNETKYEDDKDTKVQRLKEIQDKMSNIMLDWVKEFDKLFINCCEVY